MALFSPIKMRSRGGGGGCCLFPIKGFSTQVFSLRTSFPFSLIFPLPSPLLPQATVLALTLQIPIYQESGKPEEGFDHSRSLITVDEYANEAATLTPPSCLQDH